METNMQVLPSAPFLALVFITGLATGILVGVYATAPATHDASPAAYSTGWSTDPSMYGSNVTKRP